MKKYYLRKLVLFFMMAALLAVSAAAVFSADSSKEQKLAESLRQAQMCEEEGFYRDAANYYQEAAELSPENLEIKKKEVYMYLLSNEKDSFLKLAKEINRSTGGDRDIYMYLASYYLMEQDIQTAISTLKEGNSKFPMNAGIKTLLNDLRSSYNEITTGINGIFLQREDFTYVMRDNRRMLLDKNGNCLVSCEKNDVEILDATSFSEDGKEKYMVSIRDDSGNCRYVDQNGVLRRSPQKSYEYLGCRHDGMVLVENDGSWGYLDKDFNEISVWYEDATAFSQGLAAVKENNVWYVINSRFERINGKAYEDVVMDMFRCAARAGVIAMKDSEGWVLVDKNGKEISAYYDSIQCFNGEKAVVAVSKAGKNGLLDATGKEILPCEYDQLNGGSGELVKYSKDGLWGYMNREGEIITAPEFEQTFDLNGKGVAFVYRDGFWNEAEFAYYGKKSWL